MNTQMHLINDFDFNYPPDAESLKVLKSAMDFMYPDDYWNFIVKTNGAEGPLGQGYLSINSIEDVLETNKVLMNSMPEFSEKYWIFAGNSGIFQYGFEKSTGEIFELDLYDENYKVSFGKTLSEFIKTFSEKSE